MANKLFKPKYVKRILFSKNKIEKETLKAAYWIKKTYQNCKRPPILVAILKGVIPFYGNLVTNLEMDVEFDCLIVQSYRGKFRPNAKPDIVTDLVSNIKGRDVLLIDDIVDSAKTLSVLIRYLKKRKPKSIKTMVLIDKPDGRKVEFEPDYSCFTLKGKPFLVGWGLDARELGRTIPYIAEVDKKYKF